MIISRERTKMSSTVAAVRFSKEECRCSHPLFSYKYLRCFPHCCPEHSSTSFCATSIDLVCSQHGASGIEGGVAFLRMQSRGDPVLPVGAIVAASDVLSDARSHDNLRGDWVPSVYCYYNEATHEMVYQFNQATGFGWHYGWVGTAKTSHRSTQHVLIGYLFRHVATSSQEPKFCVVASTSSPPFLVMSYRRACAFCQKLRTVVLGLFTASQLKWREEAAANLLDRQALYQGDTAWLRHMHDAIGGHLGRVTWAELVDQSQQTIPSHSSGWFEYFVAQMREVFMVNLQSSLTNN
ncbi:hypothetical protein DYB37_009261 [Aphanomyces astaci]|uniref:Uncharacterized protein n=1 Tax=Aphanomyces astaci TaxID=112090 RepID=A0A3R6XZ02_APHAT|nr:hypothetical protein DYB37_009261 [Aphanomyces astaci]